MSKLISPQRPRILIIYNPKAGKRQQKILTRTVGYILAKRWDATLKPTHFAGDATRLAMQAVEDKKYQVVCVAGGDGTINEVVAGIKAANGEHLPLGIIPIGTANVLAKDLNYPTTPEGWAMALTSGLTKPVQLGLIHGAEKQFSFVCMASAGFDAEVVTALPVKLKKKLGKWAYVWQAMKSFCWLEQPVVQVKIDSRKPMDTYGVVVSNTRYYGGKFLLAPQADVSQPEFDVVCLIEKGRWPLLSMAWGLVTGRVHQQPGVKIFKGKSISIGASIASSSQLDGDAGPPLPLKASLSQTPLNFLVGSTPNDDQSKAR